MAPITDCLKKEEFSWALAATKAFVDIKTKMTIAPILRHADFSKPFEATYDTSSISIGGIFSQEGQPIVFFTEKLNDAKTILIYLRQRILCACAMS